MRRLATPIVLCFALTTLALPAAASSPVDLQTGLALPARARVDAPSQALGFHVGRVEIPAISVAETIREGVSLDVIDRGVAHWAGTARPGGVGNLVLAGHRTVHSAPFGDLDLLQRGDLVHVTAFDGTRASYQVTELLIVQPTDMWIVDQTDLPTLTLFACHPKGSARQRIVARAELIDGPLLQFP